MARLFGIEIEFVWGNRESRGENAQELCDLLTSRGIQIQNLINRHFGFSRTHWQLKYDASVSYGGEMVSPPLDFDDPVQRAQVTTVLEAMQEFGCNTDEAAGVHVHVECNDFTAKQMAAVLRFAYKFEDAIYRIASSGWEGLRPMRGTHWAKPIADYMATDAMLIRDSESLRRLWIENCGMYSRYYVVNVQKWTESGTLEFRLFNSTLNPKRANAYIALAVAIVNDARNGYSRSTAKHFPIGYMAGHDNPEQAEKAMLLKLQQILRYQSGMSEADWKLVRFCWKDSKSQTRESCSMHLAERQYGASHREMVGARPTRRRQSIYG